MFSQGLYRQYPLTVCALARILGRGRANGLTEKSRTTPRREKQEESFKQNPEVHRHGSTGFLLTGPPMLASRLGPRQVREVDPLPQRRWFLDGQVLHHHHNRRRLV